MWLFSEVPAALPWTEVEFKQLWRVPESSWSQERESGIYQQHLRRQEERYPWTQTDQKLPTKIRKSPKDNLKRCRSMQGPSHCLRTLSSPCQQTSLEEETREPTEKKKGTISPCKLKRIEIMWSSFPTTAPIPGYPEEWRLRRLDYLLLDMAQLNSIAEICIISTPIS